MIAINTHTNTHVVQWLSSYEMDTEFWVQIQAEAVCIFI